MLDRSDTKSGQYELSRLNSLHLQNILAFAFQRNAMLQLNSVDLISVENYSMIKNEYEL